jgi:hypothetical protein
VKKINDTWVNSRQEARMRLHQWARIKRTFGLQFGPKGYPSRAPFITPRVDNDAIRGRLDRLDRYDAACEVDDWIHQEIAKHSPNQFEAIYLFYVEFTGRDNADRRLEEWKKRTGLSQTRLYECRMAAERYIAMRISTTEAFKTADSST